VLTTSQEVLGLPGEAVYRLSPLVVPDPGESAEMAEVSPAVALFADRAARALNGFQLTMDNVGAVVELCRRLDGMPLAIELAAANARVLSPAQLVERLGDRFDLLAGRSGAVLGRQQSLKAALEWSYDHCSETQRLLWERLSVFPATFDLAAAEAVCTGTGLADVVKTVGELVDRSVLVSHPHASTMRYRLLETIREYGARKLREADDRGAGVPEEVLRSRHLDWYAAQAAEIDRSWFGPGQRERLERLHVELPNLRAALSFAAEHPPYGRGGLKLAGSLAYFWRVSALREGEQWLRRLLEAGSEPTEERARALVALAMLLNSRGQQGAAQVAEEALAAAASVDASLVPRAMALRAISMAGPDLASAAGELRAALAEAERTGLPSERAAAMHNLAWSLGRSDRAAEAERYFIESLSLCEDAGELSWRGAIQVRRALVAWIHGDLELMRTAATNALRASRLVDDLLTSANAVCLIGVAAVGSRDATAATLFGAAERVWEDAGGSIVAHPPWRSLLDDAKARCRAAIGVAAFDRRYRQGRHQPPEEAIAAALDESPRPPSVPPAQPDFGLTRRELEVVDLVAQGLTNKEIAQRLVISSRTADTHVQNVLTKTGFNTRAQVAAWHAARIHAQR
jgi:non-specific serine/threonine protein kinase